MRLEDKNFEKEFMTWLNSKTIEELVDSLKKYEKVTNE